MKPDPLCDILYANSGLLLRELQWHDYCKCSVQVAAPGSAQRQGIFVINRFLEVTSRLWGTASIANEVKELLGKCSWIFNWNMAKGDEALVGQQILVIVRLVLGDIEAETSGGTSR